MLLLPLSAAVPTHAAAAEAAGDDGEDDNEEKADDDTEGVAHEVFGQLWTARNWLHYREPQNTGYCAVSHTTRVQ